MTRRAIAWLIGSALVGLILAPFPLAAAVAPQTCHKQLVPVESKHHTPAIGVADDDDERRDQHAPVCAAVVVTRAKLEQPDTGSPRVVLALHSRTLGPIRVGFPKIPPRSDDAPVSH
jgi:hypothetical protein